MEPTINEFSVPHRRNIIASVETNPLTLASRKCLPAMAIVYLKTPYHRQDNAQRIGVS